MLFTQNELNYLNEKKEITLCFSPKGLPLFGYKDRNNIGFKTIEMNKAKGSLKRLLDISVKN